MSILKNLLVSCVSTILGIVGTYLATNKSNINKNTEALKTLYNQLGLNKEQTLRKSVLDKFNAISNDIGRESSSSLTQQHKDLEQLISKDFEIIAKRYEDEDIAYRNFTQQQKDLKTTLDNFSRDYYECIKNEHALYDKCTQLELQNEKLTNENLELKQIIAKQKKLLKSQSDKKRSRDITDL